MKVAITAKGNSEKDKMDLRFGRSGWLAVYDTNEKQVLFYENEAKDQQSGSGPRTAQKLADMGIQKVFSGDFGPKARTALESLGIEMVVLKDEQSISELIKNLK